MKIELSNKEADLRESRDYDWVGGNAAFKCPMCGFVFLVSGLVHGINLPLQKGESPIGERHCPKCAKSVAHIEGGQESGGEAWIEWPVEREE